MTTTSIKGLGIGWRPELAVVIERRRDLGFVEVVAENINPDSPPRALMKLIERGVPAVPHGISLSLGGADPLAEERVGHLAKVAKALDAPLVSEHIAFVRAGGMEAGHLLPLARTQASLDVLIDNIRRVMDILDVPLALENISTLFEWPQPQIPEAEFLAELFDRTDAQMLLDIANVYANCRNFHRDAAAALADFPMHRLAYAHMGGGVERDGIYHDSHAHPVPAGAIDLLSQISKITPIPAVMLERDDEFPDESTLNAELDRIKEAAGV